MDNKSTTKKLFLKPASFQSSKSENGNANENGNAPSPLVNNPFLKCEKDEPEVTNKDEKNSDPEKDPASDLFKPAKTNLFQQTGSIIPENSNFVFGQNLHERVVMENVNSTPSVDTAKSTDDAPLFSSAVITTKTSPEKDKSNDENAAEEEKLTQSVESEDKEKTESLVEAARKYEEMRGAQKRKYEEVEVTTGEEDEQNIMEISNCKLFCFVEKNWEERGRGILRLNDSKSNSYSRVVFRSSGNFRLLLNTKVWRDQICEPAGPKSVRLTAIDANGGVKIYLVQGRVDDTNQLYQFLSTRIRRAKERTPEEVKSDENFAEESEVVAEPAKKRPASE